MTNFIKPKIKTKFKKQNNKFQKLLKMFINNKIISVEMNNKLVNCLSDIMTTIDDVYEDGIDPKYQKIEKSYEK